LLVWLLAIKLGNGSNNLLGKIGPIFILVADARRVILIVFDVIPG
jgi:hypothetical protein